MATRGTGKTLEQFEKEEYDKQMKLVNQAVTSAEKANAEHLEKHNAAVDTQVANVTGRYQQDIDKADDEYREQFDANAIAEMVGQKKVEERMANMGLTDSGLNRTQQTALSVQKGNADAATRKSKLEYVQELEHLINKAVAEGEAKKANKEIELNASLADMKQKAELDAWQNATENAQKRFNTQESTLDAEYLAQLAAEQKKVEEEVEDEEEDEEKVLPSTIGKIDSHKRAETVHEKNMHGNVSTAYIIVNEDCREYVKNGASRSQISTYLRKAYEAGKISKSQYDSLRKIYLPNGSGGRYAY